MEVKLYNIIQINEMLGTTNKLFGKSLTESDVIDICVFKGYIEVEGSHYPEIYKGNLIKTDINYVVSVYPTLYLTEKAITEIKNDFNQIKGLGCIGCFN